MQLQGIMNITWTGNITAWNVTVYSFYANCYIHLHNILFANFKASLQGQIYECI